MRFEAKSTFLALFANLMWFDFLTPWHIIVDTNAETITVRKRRMILIAVREETFAFRYIRRVQTYGHIIGADIEIKIMGGTAVGKCFSKRDCKRIKQILMDYNSNRKGKGIVFA